MTAVLVTWAVLVAGCAAPAPAPAPALTTGAAAPSRAAAQQTLRRLADSILDQRQPDFQAQFGAGDATLRTTAELWWTNLAALRPTRFDLSTGRLDRAGTGDVIIDWAIPGDSGTATHRARITFAGAEARLAALAPAEPPGARPIWWADPVEVVRQGRATVLTVGTAATGRDWADRADRAAERVIKVVPESLRRGWSGSVLVELPATAAGYDRLLGGDPGRQSGYAAVAWAEGIADPLDPATDRIAVRVVVNPDSAGLDPRAAELLLTHELTHVARYDAGSSAPLWLVEGFADLVAYPAQPDLLAAAEQNLRSTVRRDGAPTALPADDDFRAGSAADLDRSYLLAWSACRLIIERYGADALHRFVAAVGGGTGVDRALRSAVGVALPRFTMDWRQNLIKDAES